MVKRDDLDEDGKRIYDMLAGGPGQDRGRDRTRRHFAVQPQSG